MATANYMSVEGLPLRTVGAVTMQAVARDFVEGTGWKPNISQPYSRRMLLRPLSIQIYLRAFAISPSDSLAKKSEWAPE